MGKTRIVSGWVLGAALTAAMSMSGLGKITGAAAEQVAAWGLADWAALIGVGEIITAVLFLIPLTLPLGALLQSAYWGGAIVTHMIDGSSFGAPAVFLIVVWVTTFLRRPAIFEGLLPQPSGDR